MPDIAYFEPAEQWGGQAKTWVRLHNRDCHIYADYYGVSIAGNWEAVSIEERRVLVYVLEEARHFHLKCVSQVHKLKPTPGTYQIDQGG